MVGSDMAIDLGTAATKIYLQNKGLILHEPSVVAVDLKSHEIIATGTRAYAMIGKTSQRVAVVGPMRRGVISDFSMAEHLIRTFVERVGGSKLFMPRVVVSVPCEMTTVEKRAMVNAVSSLGVRKICLIQEPVAAALGAGLEILEPRGRCVVDIGAGATDIAVLSLGGISVSRTVKTAGDNFDDEIIKYVRRKYRLIIGKKTAEQAKIAVGCVFPRKEKLTFKVKGRHAKNGLPYWIHLSSDEILEALLVPVLRIIRELYQVLEKTPPELLKDICEDGIVLTGASALLYGLPILMEKKMNIPVRVAADPDICVALGAGRALPFIDQMELGRAKGGLNPLSEAY